MIAKALPDGADGRVRRAGSLPIDGIGRAPTSRPRATVGVRTELARYRISEGERVLYGQRVDGVVRVTDRPAHPGGRAFLIERDLETKAELDTLITDYLHQARTLDVPPVAASLLIDVLDAAA